MYIKRYMEETIKECLEQFPIVLVTGPRQVGKTTLLQYVCDNFQYVTLDDPIILTQAVEETYLFLKNYQPPLFIDEVQYAPSIFRYLKMYVDMNKQKGSFALTGSQAFELMKGVSETLAGRMAIVELKGLSFREIHHIEFNKPFIPNEAYFNERKSQIGSGDRSEKIRTYNYPQGRITDHRIGLSIFQMEDFLNGNLDNMIDSLTAAHMAEKLKGNEEE